LLLSPVHTFHLLEDLIKTTVPIATELSHR
jgi:hypothetical protein